MNKGYSPAGTSQLLDISPITDVFISIGKYLGNVKNSELYNNKNEGSMTENQNGKVDPVAIRELISQGIPMKRKESEMSVVLVFGAEKGRA